MTSQQRRGETETESIEREDSQSAFEADTDETDERPRCLVNCPFAVVREGFAKCTDLGEGRKSEASVIFHLLNAWLIVQVRNHLQKIRIKDGQQIGHRDAMGRHRSEVLSRRTDVSPQRAADPHLPGAEEGGG